MLLLMAALATHNVFVNGAFQDGILGSSTRYQTRWSKTDHEERQSRNLQLSAAGSSSAKESCEAAKKKEEADIAPGGGSSVCTCERAVVDERYAEFIDIEDQPIVFELTCVDKRCSYCSADGETCDRFSYGALFEELTIREGNMIKDVVAQVGYFETNQYIVGRPEAVVYTEYNDPLNPGSHACSMEIDGLRCAVCEYINCVEDKQGRDSTTNSLDVFYGLNVVCSNILIGDGAGGYVEASDFETCDQGQIEAIGSTQGVFEMYDPDYGQCYTSVEGCDRDRIELEQDGFYECECKSGDLPTDGVSPFLQNVELHCEKTGNYPSSDICGTLQSDSINRSFSSYVQETNIRTIQLENGSNVVIEEFDCQLTRGFSNGCAKCKAYVDEVECSICQMGFCGTETDAEGTLAPQIICGNAVEELDDSRQIDMCRDDSANGTPFEAFAQCAYGFSKVPMVLPATEAPEDPASLLACRQRQNEFMERTSNYIDSQAMGCDCFLINEDSNVDAGTLFECRTSDGSCGTTNGGLICNDNEENKVCFHEELVQGFLPDGDKTPLTRTTTYAQGNALGESLVAKTLVLTEYGNGSDSCELLVDGEACNSCKLQTCEAIGIRPIVDCSNIADIPSLKLDTCEAYSDYPEGYLIRFMAGIEGSATANFQNCDNFITVDSAVNPWLPVNCQKAQPIVLPTLQDDPIAKFRDVSNPNNNFAFVSFVSSTTDLIFSEDELTSLQMSCEGDKGPSGSPGLWYSLVGKGKGIHASVCRQATNFDARISVYDGSCDSMSCVASTPLTGTDSDSTCDTHWLAKEGTTYYIRVHGSSASETGRFNLFLETLEQETTDTCYSEEISDFDKACLECSNAKKTKEQQFKHPEEIDCQCIERDAGEFHLTCVDLSCLKCNSRQSVCGFDTYELDVDSDGDSPAGSYESFYFMNKDEGVQANEIVSVQQTDCLEVRDPYQQCMMTKEKVMAENDSPVFCECRGISDDGHYMLLCSIYDSYEYCASGESGNDEVCAGVLFGQAISQYGTTTSEFRNYKFKRDGSDEESTITVERFDDECVVSIDQEQCSSCNILQSCVRRNAEEDVLSISAAIDNDRDIFTGISIDCSNLLEEEGATATFECGSIDGSSNSILAILEGSVSSKSKSIENIVPKDPQTIPPDAFPPTLAPVTKPTNPPLEPTVAPRHWQRPKDKDGTPIIEEDEGDEILSSNSTNSESATDVDDSAAAGFMKRQTFAFVESAIFIASIYIFL